MLQRENQEEEVDSNAAFLAAFPLDQEQPPPQEPPQQPPRQPLLLPPRQPPQEEVVGDEEDDLDEGPQSVGGDDDDEEEEDFGFGDGEGGYASATDEAPVVIEAAMAAITIENMRDGIVSKDTLRKYGYDIRAFLEYCKVHEPTFVTERCKGLVGRMEKGAHETKKAFVERRDGSFSSALRHASTLPLLEVSNITAEGFVGYMSWLSNISSGERRVSKSAYRGKRSAFFHLFRLHNGCGVPPKLSQEIGNLLIGFFRLVALEKKEAPNNVAGPNNARNQARRQRRSVKEGKEPMSPELYAKLCEWFFNWGTIDGMFCLCYLVLSWNLMCRTTNTAHIQFSHIFCNTFDSIQIHFSHSKSDQGGDEAKYGRHLYANPSSPLTCPFFALGSYLSISFNSQQTLDNLLFPGKRGSQEERFSKCLHKMLADHAEEVATMGYDPGSIGSHSIRKGAVSMISACPGGPTMASVCVRAGWTMGKIKDTYMRYMSDGDAFCGRCLAMLPLLKSEFAVSPPFFDDGADPIWVDSLSASQFESFRDIDTFGRLSPLLVASQLHQRVFVRRFPANHVLRQASYVHRNMSEIEPLLQGEGSLLRVSHAWNDSKNTFSGIPPHVSMLTELRIVKEEQGKLVGNMVVEIRKLFEEMNVNAGHMTEHRLKQIIGDKMSDVLSGFEQLAGGVRSTGATGVLEVVGQNTVEPGAMSYNWHVYDGRFNRLPRTWRFPRVGVKSIWRQWWIGNKAENVPPLRFVETSDVNFLDRIPIGTEEQHGRSGRQHQKRRPARKLLCDLKYLMGYMVEKVKAGGGWNK